MMLTGVVLYIVAVAVCAVALTLRIVISHRVDLHLHVLRVGERREFIFEE